MSWFDRNFDHSNMLRYWKMYNIQHDSSLDSQEICDAVMKLKSLAEKEIQKLMKKWISIPNL